MDLNTRVPRVYQCRWTSPLYITNAMLHRPARCQLGRYWPEAHAMAFAGHHLIAFWGHFTSVSNEDFMFTNVMTDIRQDLDQPLYSLRKIPNLEYRRNSSVWHAQWFLRTQRKSHRWGWYFQLVSNWFRLGANDCLSDSSQMSG